MVPHASAPFAVIIPPRRRWSATRLGGDGRRDTLRSFHRTGRQNTSLYSLGTPLQFERRDTLRSFHRTGRQNTSLYSLGTPLQFEHLSWEHRLVVIPSRIDHAQFPTR